MKTKINVVYDYKNENDLLITEKRTFFIMRDFYKFLQVLKVRSDIIGKPIIEKARD